MNVRNSSTWLVLMSLYGCGRSTGLDLDTASRTSGIIDGTGGTLETPTGDLLVIPPGALSEPTEITVTPVTLSSVTAGFALGALDLQPDGLVFNAPVTLTMRLSEPVAPGAELALLSTEFYSESPTTLSESGALFRASADGLTATGTIHHFSTKAILQNCHAGSRDMLFEVWSGRSDRDVASVAAATGLTPAQLGPQGKDDQYSHQSLQTILGKLFRPCGELLPAASSSAELAATLRQAAESGEAVVALFGGDMTNIENGFRTGVAHSGTVQVVGGELVVRSRLNVSESLLAELEACGKPTRVDQPFSEIDRPGHGLRDLRNGEIYPYLSFGRNLPGRDQIPRAYPHVVFYCENRTSCGSAGTVSRKQDGGCSPPEDSSDGGDTDGSSGDDGGDATDGGECPPAVVGDDGCAEGFYYSRETIACEQLECPEHAGRTYTLECCCNCWDDQSYVGVYDPCRPGLLLRCDPNPNL